MQIIQCRRDFLASASLAARPAPLGSSARRSLADEAPPEMTTIRIRREPPICICVAPAVPRGGIAARGRASPTSATCRAGEARGRSEAFARGEIDFALVSCLAASARLGGRRAAHALAGVHPGCFELFAHDTDPHASADLKGKSVGVAWPARPLTCSCRSWRRTSGSTPRTTSNWVTTDDVASRRSCSPRQDRCVPWLRDGVSGTARPQDRSRDRQHGDHGQALVPVLLLHGGRQRGLRP